MAGALRAALCSGLLLCVSGVIPMPRNARITSVNLQSTLQWDAPQFPEGNLTYTVRAKSVTLPGDTFETLGTALRLPRCDVSSLSAYGDFELQLRAEAGPRHSPWASLRFKPMDDTSVGAPEVRLRSEAGALHVDFWGPLAQHGRERWPLRHYYGSWRYRLLLWRRGPRDTHLVAQVDTKHNSEILSQLEPWTVYCVRVQALIPEWNKTGELSRELCEQTTHNGVTPVWIILSVLVGSMLAVGTAVTVCFFSSFYLYRLIKHVFCPSYVFPQHLKEFLSQPPSAAQPFPALPQEELLVCEQLAVSPQEELLVCEQLAVGPQEELLVCEQLAVGPQEELLVCEQLAVGPQEELLVCEQLAVGPQQSQPLGEGSGEASRTPGHPQHCAPGASESGTA